MGCGREGRPAAFEAARVASLYLYTDAQGEAVLRKHLKLEPPGKGANVSLMRPKDEGVFLDRVEAAKGVWCTSPTPRATMASAEPGPRIPS